jgi:MFS-type transporter involved in bile tolerance (Atg22 family)
VWVEQRDKRQVVIVMQLIMMAQAFTLALLGMALLHNLMFTLVALLLLGWGTTMTLNNSNVVIQHVVPPQMRSRVFSSYLWARQGIAPLGSLLVGTLAQQFGASMAALVCGIACLVIFGVVNVITPAVRRFIAT